MRSLLADRFPEKVRRTSGFVPTGVRALDEALGGGLPAGRITELVSAAPGTGGQTVLAQLLGMTRSARQRIALIDGADGFVPSEVPADALRHLVWVRGRNTADAFAAADILVRDGNYGVVVLDLRGLAERALLKTSATTWHRLRCATEAGSVAVLVQSATPLVPAVPWRLVLRTTVPIGMQRMNRMELAHALPVEIERGHAAAIERSA